MELEVINNQGKKTGKVVALNDDLFNAKSKNDEHVVYLEVKRYLAAQRQGTHKTKDKGEVNASTKKIKKQKGTGGARAGSRKSGLFKGGGTFFGPKPRDYSFKLNKKVKKLAKRIALTDKLNNERISVLEDQLMEKPKTKQFIELLHALELDSHKSLFILGEQNKNFYLSSRNLSKTKVITANEVTTYDLLHADYLILFESSIINLEKGLA